MQRALVKNAGNHWCCPRRVGRSDPEEGEESVEEKERQLEATASSWSKIGMNLAKSRRRSVEGAPRPNPSVISWREGTGRDMGTEDLR